MKIQPYLGKILHSKCSFKKTEEKWIQNAFLPDPFFLCFWQNILLKCPGYLIPPSPCFSGKCSILNVWQCSEYICLDNCLVICTVILCYVLHETFRILTYSELCFLRHMLKYSVIFSVMSVTKAWSPILRLSQA